MWVEFGEIKKHLLILLIYPIGIISVRISIYYNNNNPYFFLFIFFISHLLALIPLFIQKKLEKVQIRKIIVRMIWLWNKIIKIQK